MEKKEQISMLSRSLTNAHA